MHPFTQEDLGKEYALLLESGKYKECTKIILEFASRVDIYCFGFNDLNGSSKNNLKEFINLNWGKEIQENFDTKSQLLSYFVNFNEVKKGNNFIIALFELERISIIYPDIISLTLDEPYLISLNPLIIRTLYGAIYIVDHNKNILCLVDGDSGWND